MSSDQLLINEYYLEAVKELKEETLSDANLWYSHIISLPVKYQVVYTVWVFHTQIFNGGFHQYFFNAYGQFAYLTVEHLRLINAFKSADLLETAISQVNIKHYEVNEFRKRIFDRKAKRIVDFDCKLPRKLTI